jgi:chromosome segregation ATPase
LTQKSSENDAANSEATQLSKSIASLKEALRVKEGELNLIISTNNSSKNEVLLIKESLNASQLEVDDSKRKISELKFQIQVKDADLERFRGELGEKGEECSRLGTD